MKPEQCSSALILCLFIKENFQFNGCYLVKLKKVRATSHGTCVCDTDAKLCELNEFQQVHLVQHHCLCQLKCPSSIILRPRRRAPRAEGKVCGLHASRGSLGEKNKTTTARLPGYHGNEPPPDGGKPPLNINFSRKHEEKELIFSPSFTRGLFKNPFQKPMKRNSSTIRSLKCFNLNVQRKS